MSKYDVIHIHSFNPVMATAARWARKPIVYTEHGNFGFGRKRTLSDFFKSKLLSRFLRKNVHHITFNSKFTQAESLRRYNLGNTPGSVVYNGIDLSVKRDLESTNPILQGLQGSFVVGTSSRFAGFKRIDRLIAGFAEFQEGREAVLLLVGDGPLLHDLQQQVIGLGISEKTIFAGFQSNCSAFQNAMDVCVFPSNSEPFGLVAVETLTLGKPTIVFADGGGIIEVVDSLCPSDVVDSPSDLANRLADYYDDCTLVMDSAQSRVERSRAFDIVNMSKQLQSIYESLVKKC